MRVDVPMNKIQFTSNVTLSATEGIVSPTLGIVSSITPPGPGTTVRLVGNVLPDLLHS